MNAGVTHGRKNLHRFASNVEHLVDRGHCEDGVLASVDSQQGSNETSREIR